MVRVVGHFIQINGTIFSQILDILWADASRSYYFLFVCFHPEVEVAWQHQTGCGCKNNQVEVEAQLASLDLVQDGILVQLFVVYLLQPFSLHNLLCPHFSRCFLTFVSLVDVKILVESPCNRN